MSNELKIALIGNPNSGKSSVFNQLTGLRQTTGNFPGVTVDKKTGYFKLSDGSKVKLTDLPGTYSLYPNSADEQIVLKVVLDKDHKDYPDLVVYVADVNNLERHLLLCTQLIDLDIPLVLVLTMPDIAERQKLNINIEVLAEKLGVPVVYINGRTGVGVTDLKELLTKPISTGKKLTDTKKLFPIERLKLLEAGNQLNDYQTLLLAHHADKIEHLTELAKDKIRASANQAGFNSLQLQVQETIIRLDLIDELLQDVSIKENSEEESFSEKVDKILTHKVYGTIIFLGVLFLLFQSIFEWAIYPMEWIDLGFSKLAEFVQHSLPDNMITDLIAEGVIPGLAGIFIFIPQITILFAFLAFLEDIGYMSRAVFLSDSIMRKFGLNGRSMVALFSGLACAVPAIMSTRTIGNWKERLITILVTPFMSCSARIPVFTILIAFAIPPAKVLGFINLQGLVMMGLYLLGTLTALGAALILKHVLKTTSQSFFVMELPSYKTPHWKNIGLTIFEKVKIFATQAGKVIFVISILLWFLASFGPSGNVNNSDTELSQSKQLERSYAGYLGQAIEPVIKPLGFDWKIGIALITSFAAREVFVGTISTIYSVGLEDEISTIKERLRKVKNPDTGEPVFTLAVSLSLIIFYLFALQCMSTIAVVYRETNSIKWPAIQFVFMTALAYVSSFITYQVISFLTS